MGDREPDTYTSSHANDRIGGHSDEYAHAPPPGDPTLTPGLTTTVTPTFTPTQTPTPEPSSGHIAFWSSRDGVWQIYVMNGDRSGQIDLANDRGQDYLSPPCSSDGNKFVFYTRINAPQQIHIMNSDGSGRI